MGLFRRRRRIKRYEIEPLQTQLRLIRTHLAGIFSEVATLNTIVQGLDQRDRDRIEATARHQVKVEKLLDGMGLRRTAASGGAGDEGPAGD